MKKNNRAAYFIRIKREEAGGLSIFLAIVMLAVTILAGLLVDIARVSAAKNQTARALDIAAISVLAGYETDLKNEYGLFAVHMPAPDTAVFNDYIKKNLGIDADGGLFLEGLLESRQDRPARLYDYRIEHSDMRVSMPIAKADVVERQILEYMKYRAPAALATGVLDMVKQAAAASKMADATRIKVAIDRNLAKIGKEQENLRDYLHGDLNTTGTGDGYVSNFNKNSDRNNQANNIAKLYAEFAAFTKSHYDAMLSRSKSNSPDADADKSELNLIKEAKRELETAFDELAVRQTKAFLDSNSKAIGSVDKIAAISEETRQLYDSLDECMDKFEPGDLEIPFAVPLLDDVERGKNSLIDQQSAREKIESLNGNIDVIAPAVNGMNELRRDMFSYSPPASPLNNSDIMKKLTPDLSSYNYGITYDYEKAMPSNGYSDPKEFVDDRVSELLGGNDKNKDKKLSDIGINAADLPSRSQKPWWEQFFTAFEPVEFIETNKQDSQYEVLPPSDGLGYDQPTSSYKGVSEGGGIGFGESAAGDDFATRSLDDVSEVGQVLSVGFDSLRNTFYTGEYALSMFNNSAGDKYRWAGSMPPAKMAFFDAEVEYILHGNEKQSSNLFWTKVQLLAMRVAMNFIHVHSDSRKLEYARNLAFALTSWFSAGALAPLAADLIIAAWSIKEAVVDVDDLLDGKRVPFIKLAGDWKTNIGVSSADQPKTNESLKWSYIDYLRLFLLLLPRQTKLSRICDLIEINTKYAGRGLKVKDLYCEVKGELTVSVNYLFMTSAFMPGFMRTPEKRHILTAAAAKDLF